MDPADYVLGRSSKVDDAALEECVERATEATRLAVELGATKAMNQVNRRASAAEIAALLQHPPAGMVPAGGDGDDSSRRVNRRFQTRGERHGGDEKLVREYRTIYLLKAETPDDQVEDIKERLRGVVSREGGKVIRFTNQG